MKVQYGSRVLVKNEKNTRDKLYMRAETASEPIVSELEQDKCYTLLMIDPDAGKGKPSDPRPGNSDKYYLHWLIVNISGGTLSTGDVLVPYQGPTPPPGTGKHQYRFLLYEQPCGLTNGLVIKNRPNWSLESFLKGKQLTLVDKAIMHVEQ